MDDFVYQASKMLCSYDITTYYNVNKRHQRFTGKKARYKMIRLKVCRQCSREEERNPGYMCPGCDIDIYDGIRRNEGLVKVDTALSYYYEEMQLG